MHLYRRHFCIDKTRATDRVPPLSMKNNAAIAGLLVLLALSLLSAAVLTMIYNRHTSRARDLQRRAADIQNTQTILQSLASEAVAYSRNNPALAPILQKYQLVAVPGTAPATAPTPAPKR